MAQIDGWPAGEAMAISEVDEDAGRHIDTSCYLIHRSAFDLIGVWLDMPQVVAPLCDRVFLDAILNSGRSVESTGQRSVAFRSRYASHYRAAGLPVPPGAKQADFADAAWTHLRAKRS